MLRTAAQWLAVSCLQSEYTAFSRHSTGTRRSEVVPSETWSSAKAFSTFIDQITVTVAVRQVVTNNRRLSYIYGPTHIPRRYPVVIVAVNGWFRALYKILHSLQQIYFSYATTIFIQIIIIIRHLSYDLFYTTSATDSVIQKKRTATSFIISTLLTQLRFICVKYRVIEKDGRDFKPL